MAIGTFNHSWSVTSLEKVPSIGIANSVGITSTYTDFIIKAELKLRTFNLDPEHHNVPYRWASMNCSWEWNLHVLVGGAVVESTYESETFTPYEDLTENDVINMLGESDKLKYETAAENQFRIKFGNIGITTTKQTIKNPFVVGVGTT